MNNTTYMEKRQQSSMFDVIHFCKKILHKSICWLMMMFKSVSFIYVKQLLY